MIDPQAKPATYIRLMALVVVLGVISALVTFAFIALVQMGMQGFGTMPHRRWVWIYASSRSWSALPAACWSACW